MPFKALECRVCCFCPELICQKVWSNLPRIGCQLAISTLSSPNFSQGGEGAASAGNPQKRRPKTAAATLFMLERGRRVFRYPNWHSTNWNCRTRLMGWKMAVSGDGARLTLGQKSHGWGTDDSLGKIKFPCVRLQEEEFGVKWLAGNFWADKTTGHIHTRKEKPSVKAEKTLLCWEKHLIKTIDFLQGFSGFSFYKYSD